MYLVFLHEKIVYGSGWKIINLPVFVFLFTHVDILYKNVDEYNQCLGISGHWSRVFPENHSVIYRHGKELVHAITVALEVHILFFYN